ncbi:YtxH domain-containing protein [Siminovitchia fordii]|uniref:Uncharacterized protein n=1 Tax=Siminovitchia fordii TaxID=254759 RepID=A0ABQ4K7A0_9BACI|nr:YtxH domain-containing protein [Siminovitchia fordii]GIN21619.1 hypothetical protein J1TS3_27530 [Siminovitchia fordii]
MKTIKAIIIGLIVGTFIGMLLSPDPGPGLELVRIFVVILSIVLTWLINCIWQVKNV